MTKYTKISILLHWLIALAIIMQLSSGLWMVQAIKEDEHRLLAYQTYQLHKSIGLTILILSLFRLFWRFTHKPPALPKNINNFEKNAAKFSHFILYFLMIAIPFLGWAMVSINIYGIPTIFFNLFEWPHIKFLINFSDQKQLDIFIKNAHRYFSFAMIFLLFIHVAAAIKHHFIKKNNILKRILPFY